MPPITLPKPASELPAIALAIEPAASADVRSRLDREVAAAVAPLGQILTLSREASGAMRAELERLEARFRQIKAEASELSPPAAAPADPGAEVAAARLQEMCEQAGAVEQHMTESLGEVGQRVEDLEVRGGRLMRACDAVEARQGELARAAEQRLAEMERISEMPLARIEAAADAAAARLESLIQNASDAVRRFERTAREHAASELTLHEATERLSPWQGVLDGSSPGPVEDLASAMRAELRHEMTSLGAGLTQLAEAVVKLAQARAGQPKPARRKSRPVSAPPARRAAPRRKSAQQVEAKPSRSSPTSRAATSMKSTARGGRKKTLRRAAAGGARKSARAARSQPNEKPANRAKATSRRGVARKTAGARR
jgi:hypothetical protein